MNQASRRPKGKVVFLDWHGTLSTTRFWDSILGNQSHPLHDALRRASDSLFQDEKPRVRDWMRGVITSEEVVRGFDIPLDRRFKDDFLLRRLHADCRRMRITSTMVQIVRALRARAFVVVATDNMDCFERSIRLNREFEDVADDLLCSSSIGVLKAEDVERFFGPWIAAHQLHWKDALLVDDDRLTCEKFRQAGGAAIDFTEVRDLEPRVRAWLGDDRQGKAMTSGKGTTEFRGNSTER